MPETNDVLITEANLRVALDKVVAYAVKDGVLYLFTNRAVAAVFISREPLDQGLFQAGSVTKAVHVNDRGQVPC